MHVPTVGERRNNINSAAHSRDIQVVSLAAALVAVAAAVGVYLNRQGFSVALWAPAAPLVGEWFPHVGPGSVFAVLIAVAVLAWGPGLAEYLPWRRLLALAYL